MPSFGSVLTAMATPFRPDCTLDLPGARRLAAHLVDHGSDGILVGGTTGEAPTLHSDELLAVCEAVVDTVGGRATVLAGVGKNDTAASVKLARAAAGTGVDGLLVVTPYYNRPSQRGLHRHFRDVALATDLPVMLYNIPSRTACEVAPDTLLALATEVPSIRGVKDAVLDFAKTAWLAARAPAGFEIYAGDDATVLPMLAAGGVGVVSVASHLVGEDFAAMIDAFHTDPAKAREIAFRVQPLCAALFVDSSPGPLKAALALAGLPGGPVRPPLADADDSTVAVVREAMRAAGVPGG